MQLVDLRLKASTAEQEREFYFAKLRDIEVMCQMPEVKDERVGGLGWLLLTDHLICLLFTALLSGSRRSSGASRVQQGMLHGTRALTHASMKGATQAAAARIRDSASSG